MDIHRCRFVNYQPSAINALAFTHSSGTAGRNQPLRLAVGRANGDIEIWDPRKGAWIHETTLRGGKDRSVEGLAWIQDPDERDDSGFVTNGRLRLFSIGYSSTVTEWDLITGLPLRQSSGSHSEVWCLAAQPKQRLGGKKKEQVGHTQNLAVGCADGSLVLLSTADDTLSFQKYIARASKKNTRALSLMFQNRDTLVAGFADSAIRVYDIRNGNLLRTMSLGAGPQGGPKEKLVWTLDCLRDGTIVSGDSTGEVCFWDGKTYAQQQRLKGHEADVLCLAGSEDGKTVVSGGIDRRTAVYTLGGGDGQRSRWTKTAHSRHHKHDIKAMARFENSKMSLVVSGGLDTTPILTPIREYGKEYHRALPYTPQTPQVASAGRFVVSWGNTDVTIWKVLRRRRHPTSEFGDSGEEPNYKTIAQIALKGDENITSGSIAPSGMLLAVATSAQTKLFQLRARPTGTLKVQKLETPAAFSKSGSRIVQFSPDAKWLLCIGLSNEVRMFRLTFGDTAPGTVEVMTKPVLLRRLRRERTKQNSLNGEWGNYNHTITRAAFSSDSRILAVSDLAGNLDTFVLEGNEDPTAPAVDVAPRRRSSSPQSSSFDETSSDSDSDSDSDDEPKSSKHAVIFHGQHWTLNPSAKLLPRLAATPIILSFRPSLSSNSASSTAKHLPNGNPAVHSTRQNPHAHAHTLPPANSGVDRLFIVTAPHEIFEYEVLKGQLSEWSRRNTASVLPEEFKLQRDRAMGCVWDVVDPPGGVSAQQRERVWLYGANWVCMFDLAQDFPDPQSSDLALSGQKESNATTNGTSSAKSLTNGTVNTSELQVGQKTEDAVPSKKRKRDSLATAKDLARKRNTTGAGSKIPDHELGGGLGARILKKVDEDGNVTWVDIDAPALKGLGVDDLEDDDDDDETDEVDDEALKRLRRERRASTANANVDGEDLEPGGRSRTRKRRDAEAHVSDDEEGGEDPSQNRTVAASKRNPPFYLTNRYRPILGVLPMISPSSAEESTRDKAADDAEYADSEEYGDLPIEVALIERPFWDLDLPPRFVGAQEWNS